MNIKIVDRYQTTLVTYLNRGPKGSRRLSARIAFRKTAATNWTWKKGDVRGQAARNIFLRSAARAVGVSRGATGVNPGERRAAGTFLCTARKHSFKDLAVSRDFRGTRVNLVATNFSGLTAEIRRGKKEPGGKKRRGGSGAHTRGACRGRRRLIYRLNLLHKGGRSREWISKETNKVPVWNVSRRCRRIYSTARRIFRPAVNPAERSDVFNFPESRATLYGRGWNLFFFRHVIDIYPGCILRDAIKLICVN